HSRTLEHRSGKDWQTNPGRIIKGSEVNRGSVTQTISKQQVYEIANHATKQNRQATQWPWKVNSHHCNSQYCDKCHPGIKWTVSGFAYRYGCQVQPDHCYNNACYCGWHKVLDPLIAREYNDEGDDSIDDPGSNDTP